MRILAVPVLALVATLSFAISAHAADDPVKIITQSSFVDSEGRLNVVGTIRNTGAVPVQVTMGLLVEDEGGSRVVEQPTYGRVVWPLNDSPFKFVVDSGTAGEPFIIRVQAADVVNYGMIVLNYSSMAVGEERAFAGTVKNNAPFDIHNVSVFASVRSDNATQLDTVRSNVIPVLKAGEEQPFAAVPDPAVRSKVYYYSCAGLDYDDPITTIDAGNGKFIAYTMTSAAQVSSLRYENATDSIAFGIRPYAPDGGRLGLKLPQLSQNQTVAVMLDGELHEASIMGNGKTISIDFFVPKGDHQVQIQGVRNVPELPFAMLALTAVTAGIVALARFKAAFKISWGAHRFS
jgi:hypothetical protein